MTYDIDWIFIMKCIDVMLTLNKIQFSFHFYHFLLSTVSTIIHELLTRTISYYSNRKDTRLQEEYYIFVYH